MVGKHSLIRNFKQIDLFATDITFNENGASSFSTVFGACLSLLIALIVAAFGINKFFIMFNFDDTNYSEFTFENALSGEEFY